MDGGRGAAALGGNARTAPGRPPHHLLPASALRTQPCQPHSLLPPAPALGRGPQWTTLEVTCRAGCRRRRGRGVASWPSFSTAAPQARTSYEYWRQCPRSGLFLAGTRIHILEFAANHEDPWRPKELLKETFLEVQSNRKHLTVLLRAAEMRAGEAVPVILRSGARHSRCHPRAPPQTGPSPSCFSRAIDKTGLDWTWSCELRNPHSRPASLVDCLCWTMN